MTRLGAELVRELVAAVREDDALRAELRELLVADSPAEASPPWLSLDEAADYLRVSPRTLERRIARGRIRSTTIGRRRLLHRDDLDELATAAPGEEKRQPLHPDAAGTTLDPVPEEV